VFATANNEEKILDPLLDRFEAYYLTDYTDDQFREIAAKRLRQEGIEDEELALFIANAVLRGSWKKIISRCCQNCQKVKDNSRCRGDNSDT